MIENASSTLSSASPVDLTLCTKKLDALCLDTQDVDPTISVSGDVSVFQGSTGFRCFELTFFVSLLPLLVGQGPSIKN